MNNASPTDPKASGGPLNWIASDTGRPDSERDFARELLSLLKVQRMIHGQPLRLPDGAELSFAQFRLLFHLDTGGDAGLPLSRLAECGGVTPATATQAVRQLEQQQLVTRSHHPTDQRIVLISLTEKGTHAVHAAHESFNASWQQMLASLNSADLATGAQMLAEAGQMLGRLVATSDSD